MYVFVTYLHSLMMILKQVLKHKNRLARETKYKFGRREPFVIAWEQYPYIYKFKYKVAGTVCISLVPTPFELRRRKGVVHIAHACASFSLVTGHVSMVTHPMNGKQTNIR